MEAILSTVSDPSDLIHISEPTIPYRFDQIFQAEGFGAKRLAKNRLKLMKELDPHVQKLLVEGEKVQLVSWGVEYSFVEQYFMGIWSQLINRRALVFTDRRVLLIQINSRRKVLELKAQLRYEAIEKFARGTFGYIGFVLHNKKKLLLTGIPRKDRKAIKALVEAKLSATRLAAPVMVGVENLCPKCGQRVMDFPERCKQCTQAFKSGRRAGWLSLAFPGLGDLYLGHRGLGVFEIMGGMIAWGAIGIPLTWAATMEGTTWAEPAIIAGLIFAFVHGTDCWITRRVGFKGIYPEK